MYYWAGYKGHVQALPKREDDGAPTDVSCGDGDALKVRANCASEAFDTLCLFKIVNKRLWSLGRMLQPGCLIAYNVNHRRRRTLKEVHQESIGVLYLDAIWFQNCAGEMF